MTHVLSDIRILDNLLALNMNFRWQLYKVAPLEQHVDNTAVLEDGLAEEVRGLAGTLFGEVAKSAEDIWRRVYHGKQR